MEKGKQQDRSEVDEQFSRELSSATGVAVDDVRKVLTELGLSAHNFPQMTGDPAQRLRGAVKVAVSIAAM